MKENRQTCEIVRDLLPLYAEHIASPASTALVEEHLKTCPACRAELAQMEKPVPVQPEKEPDAPLRTLKLAVTRRQLRAAVCTAAAIVLVLLGCFARYAYTAYDKVSFFDARLQAHYEPADNGQNGWVLETRGENVYLRQTQEEWTYEPVRYRFPQVHDAIASLLGADTGLIRQTGWMRTDRSVWVDALDMDVSFNGQNGTWQVISSNAVAWDTVEWPE